MSLSQIRRHLALLLTVAGLAACGGEDLEARGQQLATEKGCAACHGEAGISTAPNFPNLAGQWPRYLRVQLLKYRSGQRQNAIMNAQAATLTRDDIAALAEYYASQ